MTQNINGKVVVITGASSGLGAATARHLAAQGARLVLGARRVDRPHVLTEELNLPPGAAVQTDVTDREQVKRLVDSAVAAHGRIDVIINNAGLMPHSPLERGKVDDWDRMIDVNLKGVLYGIRTTVISPGAVVSELSESVTEPDVAAGIRKFYDDYAIPAESFARMVAFAMSQPEDVDVNEILFRPTAQEL